VGLARRRGDSFRRHFGRDLGRCLIAPIRQTTEQFDGRNDDRARNAGAYADDLLRTCLLTRIGPELCLEEAARMISESYPDNANTNAFCAAIRSLKTVH